MPITVDIPGQNTSVDFPDEMSQEDIKAVLKRKFSPDVPPSQPSDIKAPQQPGERPSTTAGGPPLSLPEGAGRSTLNELARATGESLTHPGIPLPKFDIKPDDSKTVAVGKEAVNIATSIPEFF